MSRADNDPEVRIIAEAMAKYHGRGARGVWQFWTRAAASGLEALDRYRAETPNTDGMGGRA